MSFCRAHLVLGLEFPALVQVQDRHRYLQGHLSEASRRLHAPWRGAVHSSFTHATCSGSSVSNRSVTRARSPGAPPKRWRQRRPDAHVAWRRQTVAEDCVTELARVMDHILGLDQPTREEGDRVEETVEA